jgi:hypothetical protein
MADVIEQGTLVELKERRRLVNNVANHGHPQPRLPVSVDASNQQKLNDYRNRPTTRRHEPSPSHHAPHQPGPHQQVPRCQCCCWTFHPPTTAVPATPTHLSSNNNTLPQLRVSYPPSKTLSWLSTSTVATTSNPSLSMPGMQSTIPRLVLLSILDLFSCRTDRFGIITAFCSRHSAYSRPQDLPHRGWYCSRFLTFSCRTDRFGIITAFCSRHSAYSRPQDLPRRARCNLSQSKTAHGHATQRHRTPTSLYIPKLALVFR